MPSKKKILRMKNAQRKAAARFHVYVCSVLRECVFFYSMRMAACAAVAAASCTAAPFARLIKMPDDQQNDGKQGCCNQNSRKILQNPFKHKERSLKLVLYTRPDALEPIAFLVRPEQQIQEDSNKQEGDCCKDIKTAAHKQVTDLENAHRYGVRKNGLIANGKERPFCAVHFTLDCTYSGKARSAQKVKYQEGIRGNR